jgi:hypothetical protein
MAGGGTMMGVDRSDGGKLNLGAQAPVDRVFRLEPNQYHFDQNK